MKPEEIYQPIAFMQCLHRHNLRQPCNDCVVEIKSSIEDKEGINYELIEDVAIGLANMRGDYEANRFLPIQLHEAYEIITLIFPTLREKITNGSL